MTQDQLLIRADASLHMGSGHVMRCLALAQAWTDQGGSVTFVADVPDSLHERLSAEGITVHPLRAAAGTPQDAQQVIDTAKTSNTRYIVVDGYHFGAAYQRWIKAADLRLLVLDDNSHADHYTADLVLNQNIHADASLYPNREPYTRLLLGTRYALLRREFWQWRGWQRDIPGVARKVLVTMGGSDPDNVTLLVLRALEHVQQDNLTLKVIVGGSNPHYETLQAAAQDSPHSVELARDVTAMPALMAWADMAISAGGSTCWELAFMGLPSILIVLADNQSGITQGLADAHFAVSLGWANALTADQFTSEVSNRTCSRAWRTVSCQTGRALVDGEGGARVVAELKSQS